MRLKSYFAPSVDEAIERARVELGQDAMLLNSRKISQEQAHLGAYEVVFGITGEAMQRKPAPAANSRPSTFSVPASARSVAASAASASLSAPAPIASVAVKEALVPAVVPRTALAPAPVPAQTSVEKPSKRSARKPAKSSAKPATEKSSKSGSRPALANELAELRKQIQAVQNSLGNSGSDFRQSGEPGESDEEVYRQLVDFDFTNRAAQRFIEIARNGDPASGARLARRLMDEINNRFQVAPHAGKDSSERRIAMFVGPPGAGKTTTIVKLAVKLGLQRRIPVQLLSLDTMRVGGCEQLAEYARIIGVDFRALYSTASLDEVLRECAGKKLILIDTPGYAPAEMEEAEENAYFLSRHPEIEVQLVLPASLRASAFDKFSERFSVFGPTKLLFTHLDEVETFGPLLEHAMKTKLPVSFLTDGQTIPSDIQEASKERLTKGLFESLSSHSASAA